MQTIYNLSILGMVLGYRLASLFHVKARKWVRGRIGWDDRLFEELYNWPESRPRLWIHCASLGEFEQGRPLIEAIREQHPDYLVILTFFSPSGYELRKNYDGADLVCYLPADIPTSVRLFLDISRPDLVVFVKYEFWFNYLKEVQSREIPLILISALFRPGQVFFRWYGRWFRNILARFDHIFTQHLTSSELLARYGIPSIVAGDTRIDRVLQIVQHAREFPDIEEFCAPYPCLVAGSSWPPDEDLLEYWWGHRPDGCPWRMIIAPHDISEHHLQQIEKRFGRRETIRYSSLSDHSGQRILIIDNIGMLSALYRYARLAYIGGGFGAGIHNTLEPIAHGVPVLFGPRYQKFEEARALVKTGGGRSVHTGAEFTRAIRDLHRPEEYPKAQAATRTYLAQNQGATDKIMDVLFEQDLLSRRF